MIRRKSLADPIVGGPGNDNYLVTDPSQVISEAIGGGYDTVYTTVAYTLTPNSEIEVLTVYDRDTVNAINLTGNAFANVIYGNNGSNTLIGGGGADTFYGLAGDDRYLVDSTTDSVFEQAGGGYDTVYTFGDFELNNASSVEALSVYDRDTTNALTLFGNNLDNVIYGNNGANALYGGGGTDTIYGLGGNDSFVIDSADDVVIEFAGGGTDTVYTTVTYVLAADAEVETLAVYDRDTVNAVNLTGNAFANLIYGNNGSNTLIGGGGADTFYGLSGDDRYLVDSTTDSVFEQTGGGYDTVYTFGDFALNNASSVEALSVYDRDTTNALTLFGNNLNNVIYGNNGANALFGGGGTDTIYGLGGNDSFIIDSADDVVIEFAGGGNDTVYTTVSYALAATDAEVEVLTAYDRDTTNAVNLTGNGSANVIYGNAGANTIDGKGGNDTLYGMAGADNFAFTATLGAGNVDFLADFNIADDTIALGGSAGEPFAALASGALSAGSFVIGAGALDANDYLIYNSGTGALLYDADGSGGAAAIQFATLGTGLALTAADFFVSGPGNAPPAITSGATASVPENSPASTIVYQTQANDSDGDRITYSLTGADAGLFSIDSNGAVRLLNPADYEIRTTYDFTVVASDSGSSASKAVRLTVTDVADTGTPIINETPSLNDSFAAAQPIDRGTFAIAANPNLPDDDLPSATITGSISGIADQDFFSITLQAGEKLILDVDFTSGGLDSHIFVYGPSQTEIGNNDDRGLFDPGSTGIATTHNTDSFFQFRAPAAGTYYFSIKSFEGASSGGYQIHVSIAPPATAHEIKIETLEADAEALISGAQWNHTNLTYGFPQLASQYPASFDEANPASEFQPFSGVQQAATRSLLQLVANVTGLTFSELTGAPGNADLRYAMSTDNDVEAAHAYYPTNGGPTSLGGTSWYNTTSFNNPLKGNYAWMGILHETGHALGLEHGHEDGAVVSAPNDSLEFTVMTYRSYVGDPIENGYSNETFGFPQTLMMLDIAALQKIYGANFNFNSGDSVYTWNQTTGEMSINGVGQGAPGNGAGGSANRIFMTIWDGGGNDTYDLSNYTGTAKVIDLRPGEWSRLDPPQEANLGGSHYARGNVANALLYNADPRSLIENAIGSTVIDHITANQAANRLTGNAGDDFFRWDSASDAGIGALADTVTDFTRDDDVIDFRGIDAIPATAGRDQFTFIGTAAFTNTAGELRYQVIGGNAHIFADVDGNGTADMEIILNNVTTLSAWDFMFG